MIIRRLKPIFEFNTKSVIISCCIYVAVFIGCYSLINWWRQPVMPMNPQLKFTSINNQIIDLQQMSVGKSVLVYFWGSWCGICRHTSPSMNKLAKSSQYPIISVAVSSGEDKEVQEYLTQHQWNFTTVNDPNGYIFKDWQGQVTPSFVILKDGKMVQGLTGIHPAWELTLRMYMINTF